MGGGGGGSIVVGVTLTVSILFTLNYCYMADITPLETIDKMSVAFISTTKFDEEIYDIDFS